MNSLLRHGLVLGTTIWLIGCSAPQQPQYQISEQEQSQMKQNSVQRKIDYKQKAIDGIKANPNLTEEQKAEAIKRYEDAYRGSSGLGTEGESE